MRMLIVGVFAVISLFLIACSGDVSGVFQGKVGDADIEITVTGHIDGTPVAGETVTPRRTPLPTPVPNTTPPPRRPTPIPWEGYEADDFTAEFKAIQTSGYLIEVTDLIRKDRPELLTSRISEVITTVALEWIPDSNICEVKELHWGHGDERPTLGVVLKSSNRCVGSLEQKSLGEFNREMSELTRRKYDEYLAAQLAFEEALRNGQPAREPVRADYDPTEAEQLEIIKRYYRVLVTVSMYRERI